MLINAVSGVLVAMFFIPQTRVVILWPVLVLLTPVVAYRRAGLPPGWLSPALVDLATDRSSGRVAVEQASAEFRALGFTPRATIAASAEPVSRTLLHIPGHEDARAEAMVMHIEYAGTAARHLQVASRSGPATLICSTQAKPSIAPEPLTIHERLPALTRAEWLWRAHQAIVTDRHLSAPDALPATPEAFLERFTIELRRDAERLRAAGIYRLTRSGHHRLMVKGAVLLSLRELWPWRQRLSRRVAREQAATLARVGLGDLLATAAAQAAAGPSPRRTAVLKIPDDRGHARAIARADAAAADERDADPRFRALLQQAAGARKAVYARSGPVQIIVMIAGFVALRWMGVPFMAAWLASILASLGLSILRNSGRVAGAEVAAANVLLRRGLCAACLYLLDGLEPGPDGCVACPECGAAWRRDRIAAFTRFATVSPDAGLSAAHRVVGTLDAFTGGRSAGARFKDHRGRACTLVPPNLRAHRATASGTVRPRLDAARKRIRRSGLLVRVAVAGALALVFVVPMAWLLAVRGVSFNRHGATALVSLVIGCAFVLAILRGNFAYSRKTIVRAMLAQRLCPACAEDVSGLVTGDDGCGECACGAAWRTGPTPAPAPATANAPRPSA